MARLRRSWTGHTWRWTDRGHCSLCGAKYGEAHDLAVHEREEQRSGLEDSVVTWSWEAAKRHG